MFCNVPTFIGGGILYPFGMVLIYQQNPITVMFQDRFLKGMEYGV